jgi:hypothetical protein
LIAFGIDWSRSHGKSRAATKKAEQQRKRSNKENGATKKAERRQITTSHRLVLEYSLRWTTNNGARATRKKAEQLQQVASAMILMRCPCQGMGFAVRESLDMKDKVGSVRPLHLGYAVLIYKLLALKDGFVASRDHTSDKQDAGAIRVDIFTFSR